MRDRRKVRRGKFRVPPEKRKKIKHQAKRVFAIFLKAGSLVKTAAIVGLSRTRIQQILLRGNEWGFFTFPVPTISPTKDELLAALNQWGTCTKAAGFVGIRADTFRRLCKGHGISKAVLAGARNQKSRERIVKEFITLAVTLERPPSSADIQKVRGSLYQGILRHWGGFRKFLPCSASA